MIWKEKENSVSYIIQTWRDVTETIQYIVFVTKYITSTMQNNLTYVFLCDEVLVFTHTLMVKDSC